VLGCRERSPHLLLVNQTGVNQTGCGFQRLRRSASFEKSARRIPALLCWIELSVQAHLVRQQVGKSCKYFPSRRGTRQSPVKAAVEDQILAGVVVDRPEVSDSIAAEKWLSKMPEFSREANLSSDRGGWQR